MHFNKGCYLGQELTTRTHTIGVTRKRLLPFVSADNSPLPYLPVENTVIVDSKGKTCGKLRSIHGKYGVGLLRLDNVIPTSELYKPNSILPNVFIQTGGGSNNNKIEVTPYIPPWWTVKK